MRLTVIDLWRYERSTMYRAIPHLSPIGLSVIHQADEKHVECYIPTSHWPRMHHCTKYQQPKVEFAYFVPLSASKAGCVLMTVTSLVKVQADPIVFCLPRLFSFF